MKIDHIAIWTVDLELSKEFYVKWFGAIPNNRYENITKQFTSYFLKFENNSCRIELMHKPGLSKLENENILGLSHFAISVGTKELVDKITNEMSKSGIIIYSQPRNTGDGYYESVVLDPDGNKIEITL